MTTREEALRSVVDRFARAPFEWGRFDCCQFARSVILELRGVDPAPFSDYRDEDAAAKILEAHGGLLGFLTSILGEPVDRSRLRTADVALVSLPMVGELVGVVTPNGSALVPMPIGLERVPCNRILIGWAV